MKARAVLFAVAVALAPAQQNPPGIVIKTETRVVQVDAVVTDRSGNPIAGLTAKDFRLWEDNKEQQITSVSLENHAASGAPPSRTVFVFNNAETPVRQIAAQLAATYASPQSLMAVAEFSRGLSLTQNFTADGQRLRQAIADARAGVLTGAAPSVPGGRGLAAAANGSPRRQQDPAEVLRAIGDLAVSLRDLPGRKTIVLLSSPIPLDQNTTDVLNHTISLCNRVDASVYSLEAGGVASPLWSDQSQQRPPARGAINRPNDSTAPSDVILRALAKGTGGYVLKDSDDLSGGLARVLKEESGYYLLAYTPPSSPDGSCHGLRVKVDRSADVRARSAYCNSKPPDLLAGKPIEHDLESRLAGDQASKLSASMQLPYFYLAPGIAVVNVALEVPSTLVQFDKVKGRHHGEANVLGIAYKPDGSVAARFSDTVPFDLSNPVEVQEFHARPLHYEKQLRIAPGKYTFGVVVAGAGENLVKVQSPLSIEPFQAGSLMLSALTLSREMRAVSEAGGDSETLLMEGRTALVYHDGRVVPFGGNQFVRTDSLVIYLEAYDPDAESAQPPTLDVRTRILDRQTGAEKLNGAVRIEAAEVAGKRAVPYALRCALQTLSPAWYTAEVKVTDSAGRSMTRSVDFEVR